MDAQLLAVTEILATTPGVKEARPLGEEEQRALLEPWFGPDLPLDRLPIPRLVEVIENDEALMPTGCVPDWRAKPPVPFWMIMHGGVSLW